MLASYVSEVSLLLGRRSTNSPHLEAKYKGAYKFRNAMFRALPRTHFFICTASRLLHSVPCPIPCSFLIFKNNRRSSRASTFFFYIYKSCFIAFIFNLMEELTEADFRIIENVSARDLWVRDQPNTEACSWHTSKSNDFYLYVLTACSRDGFDRTPVLIQTNARSGDYYFKSIASPNGFPERVISLLHTID